jgi:hypothetical protein
MVLFEDSNGRPYTKCFSTVPGICLFAEHFMPILMEMVKAEKSDTVGVLLMRS